MNLDDPIELLLNAASALSGAKIRHATYGGLALAAYGRPRETRDGAFALAGASIEEAEAALATMGLQLACSFRKTVFGGHWITRFAVLGGGQLNTVDLVEPRSARYADAAASRALVGTLRGHEIALLAPEDFVLFKILSTRDRDLEDARAVVAELGSTLDRDLIDREAETLIAELPDHEVDARFRAVFPSP